MKTKIREIEQGEVFALTIAKENSGIFRAGWKPEELSSLVVMVERCNEAESGKIAVVALDGEAEPRLMRVHLQKGHVLLETPKNLDFPNSVGELIALTEEEAKTRLEILGRIKQIIFSLSEGGKGNDEE